ncbi:spermine oxidase [Orussus abietinus]|uniref:spermine oxidase n=1 Tax=Orussus abietinus TaxID=222816 RepID=UPI00062643E2|nr:spermine oxidase [Orussus abietinus]
MWTRVVIFFTFNLCFQLVRCDSSRIIVVGAGSAGIAAASKLFENGFKNVTILEAENRIGGRVCRKQLGEYFVDLGGQWVHGKVGNVAYEMASPLGLIEENPNPLLNLSIFDSSGSQLDHEITKNISDFFINLMDDDVKFAPKHTNASIGDIAIKEFQDYFKEHPEINSDLSQGLLYMFELMELTLDSADNWTDISLQTYGEYWPCTGSQLYGWKEKTYATILDILMKKYPDPGKELPVLNNTILNAEVTKIDYSNDIVSITTNRGDVYSADYVIVTPSLGVLKEQHQTLFEPPLPDWKVNAIEGINFGNVAKIFLLFEEQWWPEMFYATFAWKETDRLELEKDPKKKWLRGFFSAFSDNYRPKLLCGWMSSTAAREMEQVSEEDVLEGVTEVLHRFIGKDYNITRPVKLLRSQWYSNKHFRGTYSYHGIETESRNVKPAQLAEPLTKNDKPVVLFAGEASNDHHFSTVHGAIETGWREADRIIKLESN